MGYTTGDIRNIVLVGHAGRQDHAGRGAAARAPARSRATGSVERGTTVCDFDPLEKQHQHSLYSAVLPLRPPAARMST